MKVTCESCGAIYRIPEEKLTKEVSRATCKKCGAKIIIRRPSATEDGLDDLRVGGGRTEQTDEDSVIDHEERTVIAHVPELQKFDATPPLSTGAVASQDDLGAVLGGSPVPGAASVPTPEPSFATPPSVEEEYQEKTEVRPSTQPSAPAAKLGSSQPPATATAAPERAPAAQAQPAAPVPPPKITADTSPAPPSGTSAPTPTPTAPPPTQPATLGRRKKADVVEIFSHSDKPAEVEEFQQPRPKLVLVFMGLAFLGVLAFVHHGLWGLTNLTAAGFFLALYSILAAFLAQLDLTIGKRINYVRMFLIPAALCALLLGILMAVQADDLAFLYPDVDIKLVQRWIRERPEVPAAVQGEDLETRIAATFKAKNRRHRKPGLRRPGPKPTPHARPSTPAPQAAPSLPPGVDPSLLIGRSKSDLPKSDLGAVARVNLNTAAIEKELDRLRVGICFDTHSRGYDVSGKITFRIQIDPEGRVRQAEISSPQTLRRTELEACMVNKVKKGQFPSFSGSKPEWYTKVYLR